MSRICELPEVKVRRPASRERRLIENYELRIEDFYPTDTRVQNQFSTLNSQFEIEPSQSSTCF